MDSSSLLRPLTPKATPLNRPTFKCSWDCKILLSCPPQEQQHLLEGHFSITTHYHKSGNFGSHIEYPTGTKNSNFVEDHPRNIPAKFGSNRPSGFGEEAWNVKSLQTTDDGRQVMAIVHLDQRSRCIGSLTNLATWFPCGRERTYLFWGH
jgi:hypothetical protein